MIEISNADFHQAQRLLKSLSSFRGTTLKEREAIRKAKLLTKKLDKKEDQCRRQER